MLTQNIDHEAGTALNRNYLALLFAIKYQHKITPDQALVAAGAKVKGPCRVTDQWESKYSEELIKQWEHEYKQLGDWKLVAAKYGVKWRTIYQTVYRYHEWQERRG
jgi:hypothetical protein